MNKNKILAYLWHPDVIITIHKTRPQYHPKYYFQYHNLIQYGAKR